MDKLNQFISHLRQQGDTKQLGMGKTDEWFVIREDLLQDLIFNATGRRDV